MCNDIVLSYLDQFYLCLCLLFCCLFNTAIHVILYYDVFERVGRIIPTTKKNQNKSIFNQSTFIYVLYFSVVYEFKSSLDLIENAKL